MKYFTYEVWSNFSNQNKEEFEKMRELWSEYEMIFQSLSERLPKDVFQRFSSDVFFSSEGFHDYRLVKLELEHDHYGIPHPLSVHLTVANHTNNENYEQWKLTFKQVSMFNVQHTTEDNEFWIHRGFDDWGYTEFLSVNSSTLSFETLFASGATILIHFPNHAVSVNKIKKA